MSAARALVMWRPGRPIPAPGIDTATGPPTGQVPDTHGAGLPRHPHRPSSTTTDHPPRPRPAGFRASAVTGYLFRAHRRPSAATPADRASDTPGRRSVPGTDARLAVAG
jgi:hypothetical protein